MSDIKSPRVIKLKAALFVALLAFSAGLLLAPDFSLQKVALLLICLWAACRAYYFCFYVIHHYVDPNFKYSGIYAMLRQMIINRRVNR